MTSVSTDKDLVLTERRPEQFSHIVVLKLDGKVTHHTNSEGIADGGSAELRNKFRALEKSGVKNVLLDLEGVGYIDASGIGELVSGLRLFRDAGGTLKLLNITQKIQDLLTITKLLIVFDVFDNEAAALASFQ